MPLAGFTTPPFLGIHFLPEFRYDEMPNTSTPSPSPYAPGTSVVLKDDPKGPVRTVTATRKSSTGMSYTVVWLDQTDARCTAEFPASELTRMIDD